MSKHINLLPIEEGHIRDQESYPGVHRQDTSLGNLDGTSQGNSMHCGGGVTLYLNDTHIFNLKIGLGYGTNNYAQLSSLKLLILFMVEKQVIYLQVFGESLNVINWMNTY
jgi:ribonuclease HI